MPQPEFSTKKQTRPRKDRAPKVTIRLEPSNDAGRDTNVLVVAHAVKALRHPIKLHDALRKCAMPNIGATTDHHVKPVQIRKSR
jgi:hypothetical protein